MADNVERLQALRDDTVPLRPVYEPYNTAANTLVDLVHQSLDLSVGRPTIQVGIAEATGAKYYRKLNKRRKPKMTKEDMRKTFGKPYGVATLGVEGLNTFWREHPLALPQIGNGVRGYAACATRVFHDGALDRGGRYYGAWTTLNSEYHLQSTTDGEPLAEIDLNASQPTLFSSMLGMRMCVGGMWEDLYAIVASHVDRTDIDVEDDNATKRNKLKQVTVELIGTGNAFKRQEAEQGRFTFKDGEYARYRNALTKVVPALHQLNDEYYNGSGFISFHEAQMIMLTLHQLKDMGVVAYPVHDSLLVKDKEVDTALNVYRETIRGYIKEHGHGSIDILVPVSVERSGKEKQRVVGLYS